MIEPGFPHERHSFLSYLTWHLLALFYRDFILIPWLLLFTLFNLEFFSSILHLACSGEDVDVLCYLSRLRGVVGSIYGTPFCHLRSSLYPFGFFVWFLFSNYDRYYNVSPLSFL